MPARILRCLLDSFSYEVSFESGIPFTMIRHVQLLKKFHGEVTEDVVNFKEILSGFHNLVAIDTVEKIGVRWRI